eukprot:6085635-Amphidinium_carterae.1
MALCTPTSRGQEAQHSLKWAKPTRLVEITSITKDVVVLVGFASNMFLPCAPPFEVRSLGQWTCRLYVLPADWLLLEAVKVLLSSRAERLVYEGINSNDACCMHYIAIASVQRKRHVLVHRLDCERGLKMWLTLSLHWSLDRDLEL